MEEKTKVGSHSKTYSLTKTQSVTLVIAVAIVILFVLFNSSEGVAYYDDSDKELFLNSQTLNLPKV